MSKRSAFLFIDRDGTLIDEPLPTRQIDTLEKLRFERGVIPALLRFQEAGYRLVIVSNQNGIGSASFPSDDFWKPHNKMMEFFADQGICFEASLVCPHLPADNCACRKPKLGLVKDYLQGGEIDFERSYMIGDRQTDVELGTAMGIGGLLYDREKLNWKDIATLILDAPRRATRERRTKETSISLSLDLDLDASGSSIKTGHGFFDHMLEQIAAHAGIAITLSVEGDWHVDDHHSIEDVALVLGDALSAALGERRAIGRYGFTLPMDESLASCAIDLSGRPACVFKAEFSRESVAGLATEMVKHFFQSLSVTLGAAIHLSVEGENAHHMIEGLFKAFGRALRQAIAKNNESGIPSTKGVL